MIIDISWPITQNITEYKDRGSVRLEPLAQAKERGVCETLITMHSHTGTHIDAPSHFIEGGKTIDQLPLSHCIGQCTVLDLTHVQEKITVHDLEAFTIHTGDRILFKTRNSALSPDALFDYAFVYLAECAARYLVGKNVQLVGIDYLGIERNQPGHPTHKLLLGNGIAVLEGLRLGHVAPGNYTLICFPVALCGVDAAPARAVLCPLEG